MAMLGVMATTGWSPARGDDDAVPPRPRVAMVIAEDEYGTEKTLPEFVRSERLDRDFDIEIVTAKDDAPNDLPGLVPALEKADVLVLSVRRRPLVPAQMEAVRRFVAAGKPVVAIRTSCHAFCLRDKPAPRGLADWPTFDPEVIGGHYTNHHGVGPTTTVTVAPDAGGSALLRGVDVASFHGAGSLYMVSPLNSKAKPLLIGSVPNQEAEPVAWTFTRPDGGRTFFTSLGHKGDFAQAPFRKLLTNAIGWAASPAAPK
jgi:type 1 glutamine amidotransferase